TVSVSVTANKADDPAGNGNLVSNTLSTVFDSVAPTVSMTSAAGNPTNANPIHVTVTFSETVTGFTSGDITPVNATVANFTGSGTSYAFTLTPLSQGLVTADIASAAASDSAGNGNIPASQFTRTYQTDNTKPVISAHATANGSPYAAGDWTRYDVVVSFTCADEPGGSGLASNTVAG